MNEFIKIFEKLYLWQFSIIIAFFLLVLGFTGGIPFTEIELHEGQGNKAVTGGMIFFLLGVNLKLMMMLIDKESDGR